MLNQEDIIKDFPILKNSDIVYLDNGATTQKPIQVLKKLESFYSNSNANPYRGLYTLSENSTIEYNKAREKVQKFINAKFLEEIIFTKNTTEAINLVANSYGLSNINKDDEVVISIMEHHSNLVPWQKVTKDKNAKLNYMYINENFELSKEEISKKITNKTKIVAITHVSNVLGTINPIKYIIQEAHKKGAVVLVDCAQSVSHIKIDVQDLNADFIVFSGHKMFGPLGIGVLYGKKDLLECMPPFLLGGDMIEYVYEQDTKFASLPNKFEAGTPNVSGAIGLGAAIEYLEELGLENIQKIETDILNYAKSKLEELDFIKLYYTSDKKNHCSVISFNVKNVHPHDVATILNNYNIAIRAGDHCAQPLIRYMKISSTCRISINFYNTKEDIDKLIIALKKAYDMFAKFKRNGE